MLDFTCFEVLFYICCIEFEFRLRFDCILTEFWLHSSCIWLHFENGAGKEIFLLKKENFLSLIFRIIRIFLTSSHRKWKNVQMMNPFLVGAVIKSSSRINKMLTHHLAMGLPRIHKVLQARQISKIWLELDIIQFSCSSFLSVISRWWNFSFIIIDSHGLDARSEIKP